MGGGGLRASPWPVMLALALAVSCDESGSTSEQTLVPDRIATVQIPLSANSSIALLSDETTACVIESYDSQVHCVNRNGDVIGTFGRAGEGPGEFGALSRLVGGPDNTVGAVDTRLNRFSVFEPSGSLVGEVVLPGAGFSLRPVWRFATALAGVAIVTFDPAVVTAGAGPGGMLALFEVDMASGEAVRREVPPVDAEVECGMILYGFPNPEGGWVYVACEGHMVFVGEDGDIDVLQAPTYTGELASERDVAAWREGRRMMERLGAGIDREELERYRNTPKNYHIVFGEQKFDERGRLWIATQRDHDVFGGRAATPAGRPGRHRGEGGRLVRRGGVAVRWVMLGLEQSGPGENHCVLALNHRAGQDRDAE